MNSVTISYGGVHQAYQMALAAAEAGCLDRFLCSFFDGPAKWGRRLSALLGEEALRNRRLDGIPVAKVAEYPWPELMFKLRQRTVGAPGNAWIFAAHKFDRWVSTQIPKLPCRVFVGVENCAFNSFQVAKEQGLKLVYDCPGFNARHTQAAAEETAKRFGLSTVTVGDTPEMERRKAVEIELADHVLCCSQVHAESLRGIGVSKEKAVVIPLWIDAGFWTQAPDAGSSGRQSAPSETRKKLRVIFAGGINLRKGVPFLIEAVRNLAPRAHLTLVGSLGDDVKPCLAGVESFSEVLASVPKTRLRDLYHTHDVLVLPSLGDSFGFVGLEAMACGLPVVVTETCGVPVPDESWRVPVMDSDAIARRLEFYADDRDALAADGERARAFAEQFTPERYRRQIAGLYQELLRTRK